MPAQPIHMNWECRLSGIESKQTWFDSMRSRRAAALGRGLRTQEASRQEVGLARTSIARREQLICRKPA
jgi:hypothetical protein